MLRLWRSVRDRGILGNHEVSVLPSFSGIRPRRLESIQRLFDAGDVADLLQQLRNLPILVYLPSAGDGPDCRIVHTGLRPSWSLLAIAGTLNDFPHSDAWMQSKDVFLRSRFAVARTTVGCVFTRVRQRTAGLPAFPGIPSTRERRSWFMGIGRFEDTTAVPAAWGLDLGDVYRGWLKTWCQEVNRIVRVGSQQSR